jgi:hypothetical protein
MDGDRDLDLWFYLILQTINPYIVPHMFCELHGSDVDLRFCNETNIWLNTDHTVKAYELTGYKANNTILTTHRLLHLLFVYLLFGFFS